ncbi:hypothetical protein GQ457_12G021920 [Hibiscus cannabinus]
MCCYIPPSLYILPEALVGLHFHVLQCYAVWLNICNVFVLLNEGFSQILPRSYFVPGAIGPCGKGGADPPPGRVGARVTQRLNGVVLGARVLKALSLSGERPAEQRRGPPFAAVCRRLPSAVAAAPEHMQSRRSVRVSLLNTVLGLIFPKSDLVALDLRKTVDTYIYWKGGAKAVVAVCQAVGRW